MERVKKVSFLAALPPIQSAMNVSGQKDGPTRIKLDVPTEELPTVIKMLLWREELVRVTVEAEDG